MSVKLTGEQMVIVKGLMDYAQAFCNQVQHIMQNHGLDKVDGCRLNLWVDPDDKVISRNITIGMDVDRDFGRLKMVAGRDDEKYEHLGENSAEYLLLFENTDRKEAMRKALEEKPLPVDGFWVGRDFMEE